MAKRPALTQTHRCPRCGFVSSDQWFLGSCRNVEACQRRQAKQQQRPRDLTVEEVDALRRYANIYGRTWKQELRSAWMAASEPGLLHALRNDPAFGPSGLAAFRFPEDRA